MENEVWQNTLEMQGFMQRVSAAKIEQQCLGIFWLGQAGFLIKTPGGQLIAIDPYLTDYCQRVAGFKRIMLPVVSPAEFQTDFLFISHEHSDHFDVDLIKEMKNKPNFKIYAPAGCAIQAEEAGLHSSQYFILALNSKVNFDEFSVITVKADHGELSPDAVGFIFDFKFVKVYFAGDTAYSPELLHEVFDIKPEISLLPINGEYGNLNAEEATKLAGGICSKVVIPCHFWTFIEHGACPLNMKRIMEKDHPEIKLIFLAQGEGCIYRNINGVADQ